MTNNKINSIVNANKEFDKIIFELQSIAISTFDKENQRANIINRLNRTKNSVSKACQLFISHDMELTEEEPKEIILEVIETLASNKKIVAKKGVNNPLVTLKKIVTNLYELHVIQVEQ